MSDGTGVSPGLIVGLAISLFVLTWCCWNCRRPDKRLTRSDLDAAGVDKTVKVVRRFSKDAVVAMTEAFKQGADFRWLVSGGDGLQPEFNDPSTPAAVRHHELVSYLMRLLTHFGAQRAHLLQVDDEKDGTFLGGMILVPPGSSTVDGMHYLRAAMKSGMPPPIKWGGDARERFYATFENDEHHAKLMGKTVHWYVSVLAVTPNAQGKGVGKRLLEAAHKLAGSLPLYLECHDGNVPYYQHRGYELMERFEIAKKMEHPFAFNGMKRPHGVAPGGTDVESAGATAGAASRAVAPEAAS